MKVQAQNLKSGDKVGSGEIVLQVWNNGLNIPTGKCQVLLEKNKTKCRTAVWGKTTMINIIREENNS